MRLDPRIQIIDERLKGIGKIWAVSSVKGGVGKSTLSALLSLKLEDMGYRVGLVDLDFFGPSCHFILGVKDGKPEEEYGIKPVNLSGIEFMSLVFFTENKPLVLRGKEVTDVILELFTITRWGELDYLIIDMPPGMGDTFLDTLRFLKQAEIILVTNPSRLSLETVEKEVGFLKSQIHPILGLVENMKLTEIDLVKNKCKDWNIRYIGALPFDGNLESALGNIEALKETILFRELSKNISVINNEKNGEG